MNGLTQFADMFVLRWEGAKPRTRLVIGAVVVLLIGVVGLTPKSVFGMPLAWPYVGLIAAVGWGRSGLAFGPMVFLIFFGFAQDVSQARLSFGLPVITLFLGMVLVWLAATVSSGHAVRIIPLMTAYFATLIVQMLIAPLFDLGIRRGLSGGGV